MNKDNPVQLTTERGLTSFYVIYRKYPDSHTFLVTFKDEDMSEHEFSVSKEIYSVMAPIDLVDLYATGYAAGRLQGHWEKSRRLSQLFTELKNEAL